MSIPFTFLKEPRPEADTLVIPVYEDQLESPGVAAFQSENGKVLSRAMENHAKFKGRPGQTYIVPLHLETGYARVVLLGLGQKNKIDAIVCEKAGGALCLALRPTSAGHVTLLAEDEFHGEGIGAPAVAAHICNGLKLRNYRFDKYKTKKKDDEDDQPTLKQVDVVTGHHAPAQAAFAELDNVAQGTLLARDLTNEPPNKLNPETFAEWIRDELKPLGVEVGVFDEKKLEKLGMGAFCAVGQASAVPPRMVVMRWKGENPGKKPPVAFVGKGLTYDSGGLNLKQAKGLELMRLDMGGAGTVVGLMKTLALRKSKADVIGIAGLAENMISGNSYRPSDILTSMSGKTIEVLNTDAEGRLVLADCLTYAQKTFKPEVVIDLATLTGTMLGTDYCATFANDDELWSRLEAASRQTGEKVWRMPLDELWRKDIESSVADIKNLGSASGFAATCTAAAFLEAFVEKDVKWAHLDIAGSAWLLSDRPTCPKGPSGYGVRLLNRFVADHYE